MSVIPEKRMSQKEYLEFERRSDEKHEYLDGQIFAMPGAKRNHNKIVANLSGLLWQNLKSKDCEFYPNDMRVFIPKTGLYTYPDLVVVCGDPQFLDAVPDTLLNPVLLIEVLSESTEGYDRGKKFQHYRSIDSLNEYILVSQNEARIEKYLKQGDGFWALSEAIGLESAIQIDSIDCEFTLGDIFAKVIQS
jgi:Uma2 family endonuclease